MNQTSVVDIKEIIMMGGILLQFFALILIYLQVRADHDRRKKQATFDYISTKYVETRLELEKLYGFEYIGTETVSEIISNQDKMAHLIKLMSIIEYLCTGINTGVYDLHTAYRTSGTSFIKTFSRLEKIIHHRRQTISPKILIEYEFVVNKFIAIRNKENDQTKIGKIKNLFA